VIDLDCQDRTVVEAAVPVDGPVMRLLRGIFPTFMEGAVAYGAALHGYPSLGYPHANPDEQRMSRFWPCQ
jgi:hypothetical protein